MRLRELTKNLTHHEVRHFTAVKGEEQMKQESQDNKEKVQHNITQADIDEALAETIQQRVTPYAHLTYTQ